MMSVSQGIGKTAKILKNRRYTRKCGSKYGFVHEVANADRVTNLDAKY